MAAINETKAIRGNLFNIDGSFDLTSRKCDHVSFSRWRTMVFNHLEEILPVSEAHTAFHNFGLLELGLAYDHDKSVEEAANEISGASERPMVTVIRTSE